MKKSAVVVYVIRVSGNVLRVTRIGKRVCIRRIGTYTHAPPDQRAVLAAIREQ